MEEFITLGELILLLTLYGGPAYLLGAALTWASLPRSAQPSARRTTRRVAVLLGALLVAILLTFAFWWLLGALPRRLAGFVPTPDFLGFGAYVVPPAILASLLAFPLAAWLLRRRAWAAA